MSNTHLPLGLISASDIIDEQPFFEVQYIDGFRDRLNAWRLAVKWLSRNAETSHDALLARKYNIAVGMWKKHLRPWDSLRASKLNCHFSYIVSKTRSGP